MSRAERKAATRGELLDAARRVFVARGYHGASLDRVAAEAGYTKGAVYSAFASKGAMFLAVYEREVDERWTRIEAGVEDALAHGGAPDPGAESARDFVARVRAERGWTLALLEFRLHAARDPELNAAYGERHRAIIGRYARVLARVTGRPPADTHAAAVVLVAISNGFALEHIAIPDDAPESLLEDAASALVDVLSPRRPQGRSDA